MKYQLDYNSLSPLETRVKAYEEFRKLRTSRARKEVVNLLSKGFSLSASTVYNWFNGGDPFGRRAGKVAKIPQLLYVIGALLGDGTIFHWRGRFQVWLVGEEEFAVKYASKLSLCLGRTVRHYKYGSKNAWFVEVENAELYFLIKSIRKDPSSIRYLIGRVGPEKALVQLVEGLFDAEGCVKIIDKRTRKTPKVCLDFGNNNLALVGIMWRAIYRSLGIRARITKDSHRPHRKLTYRLRIYKKSEIGRFLEVIHTTKSTPSKRILVESWLLKKW